MTLRPPDLTKDITLQPGLPPLAHGGYADLWQAEWNGPHGFEKVHFSYLSLHIPKLKLLR